MAFDAFVGWMMDWIFVSLLTCLIFTIFGAAILFPIMRLHLHISYGSNRCYGWKILQDIMDVSWDARYDYFFQ